MLRFVHLIACHLPVVSVCTSTGGTNDVCSVTCFTFVVLVVKCAIVLTSPYLQGLISCNLDRWESTRLRRQRINPIWIGSVVSCHVRFWVVFPADIFESLKLALNFYLLRVKAPTALRLVIYWWFSLLRAPSNLIIINQCPKRHCLTLVSYTTRKWLFLCSCAKRIRWRRNVVAVLIIEVHEKVCGNLSV